MRHITVILFNWHTDCMTFELKHTLMFLVHSVTETQLKNASLLPNKPLVLNTTIVWSSEQRHIEVGMI